MWNYGNTLMKRIAQTIVLIASFARFAVWAAEPGVDSSVELTVATERSTDKVVSKTYTLKHADPYEIKPILEAMVGQN